MAELEAVVAVCGARLTGQAEFVQDRVHEIARAVASKGTPGAVGSVGARREAQDENTGSWVPEAGDGTRPVGLVQVGAAFRLANSLTVFTEARTEFAGDD